MSGCRGLLSMPISVRIKKHPQSSLSFQEWSLNHMTVSLLPMTPNSTFSRALSGIPMTAHTYLNLATSISFILLNAQNRRHFIDTLGSIMTLKIFLETLLFYGAPRLLVKMYFRD